MKKIPSLFQRDYDKTRLVFDVVVPGAEWVIAGEGVATIKYDGTACLVQGGKLWRRYDAKQGKAPPDGWVPCEAAGDPKTGHWPGWLPVGDGPDEQWHREAWDSRGVLELEVGTYELVGPKVQGNPYRLKRHTLWRHGLEIVGVPRTFDGLKAWFMANVMEGIVWHHADGRMVKIKRKDFGFAWPPADLARATITEKWQPGGGKDDGLGGEVE